jgi:hypothetical protein
MFKYLLSESFNIGSKYALWRSNWEEWISSKEDKQPHLVCLGNIFGVLLAPDTANTVPLG